jgi:hypothetical protein
MGESSTGDEFDESVVCSMSTNMRRRRTRGLNVTAEVVELPWMVSLRSRIRSVASRAVICSLNNLVSDAAHPMNVEVRSR